MPKKYADMTPLELRKELHAIDAAIEAKVPELVAQAKLVKSILAGKEVGSAGTPPYSSAKTPRDAIELCLNLSGDFVLTKREMVDAIVGGGYLGPKPDAAHALINNSINHHLRYGNLILRGERVGRPKTSKSR